MNLVDQLMRETKKSLVSLSFKDGARTITIEYDPDCKTYKSTTIAPYKKKSIVAGVENVRAVLNSISIPVLEETMNKIQKEIDQHYTAKLRLTRLALENFEDKDIIKIMKVLDIVCVPYRYVGMGNRYYIGENVHVRLADETGWNINGELHLQKITKSSDEVMNFHFYSKDSELDILKEIAAL